MKKSALLCLFIGFTLTSFGQARDTAFAVHKLFQQRRGSNQVPPDPGPTYITKESISLRTIRPASQDLAAVLAPEDQPWLLELWQEHRALAFSAEREALLLERYAAGWSIPADIRRKLRPKHFHRTKRDLASSAL